MVDVPGCKDTANWNVQLTNCIIPYYEPPVTGVTDSIIGSELTQLYYFLISGGYHRLNNIFPINDPTQGSTDRSDLPGWAV